MTGEPSLINYLLGCGDILTMGEDMSSEKARFHYSGLSDLPRDFHRHFVW
jgi:hypothetical protein